MPADRLDLEAVFHAARRLPPDERAAYLDQACADDPARRQRVERLLAAQPDLGSFLEPPAPELADTTRDWPGLAEHPGMAIGPYRLLEQIGEGGFGAVFLAEQEHPVRRRVAVKVIKPGMDTRQVIARFDQERQALALMDHPNIAKVFDAGQTPTGRPFFVMELVPGVPVTAYCDQARLRPRDRLDLFVAVCQAVQHAHQKGVIHRDLKPSNILVAADDGRPAVKVIDFGVAKAAAGRLTDKTLVTGVAQLVGTPMYMSPEQAAQSPDIDTRSDVYSLGVLLYELLTGTTPFARERFRSAGPDDIRRIVGEEDPPPPSARLSRSRDTLPAVCADRQTDPAQLSRLVRGELDWIVMKCLEKDRARRYQTAADLALDVQRYLRDEPVQAGPPAAWYRFAKFARRNRVLLAVGGGIAAVLGAAVVALAVGAARLAREERDKSLALDSERAALGRESDALAKERAANEELRKALYRHRIGLAHREWLASNVPEAAQLLDDCPAELRDWEWYYLKRLCHTSSAKFSGRALGAGGLAVSPDGARVAFHQADGVVRVWDVTGEGADGVLELRANPAGPLEFSPDGRQLIAAGAAGPIVWDLAAGKEAAPPAGPRGKIRCLAYSPDGHRLAAGLAGGGGVRVWNLATGQEVRTLPGDPQREVTSVAYSPDGKWLASATLLEHTVKVWEADTGRLARTLPGRRVVAFGTLPGPVGTVLAAVGEDPSEAVVWDPATGRKVWVLREHTLEVQDVEFSRDGRYLATAGADHLVQVWDTADRRLVRTYRGHSASVKHVRCAPAGRRLASLAWDGSVRVWDLAADQEATVYRRSAWEAPTSVAFGPGGRCLALFTGRGTAGVFDLAAGTEVLDGGPVVSGYSRLGPGGRHLAWVTPDRTLTICDVPGGRPVRVFGKGLGGGGVPELSPDGRHVGVAGQDRVYRVWEVATGRLVVERPFAQGTPRAAFSRDGRRAAAFLEMGELVVVWDLAAGTELRTFRGAPAGASIGLSADGGRVAWASRNVIWVADVDAGREEFVLRGHRDSVHALAFTPDGRRLASGGSDGGIRLWDLGSGHEVLSLRAHLQDAGQLLFSPDGKRLATGGRDGTVKVWDATPVGEPAAGR